MGMDLSVLRLLRPLPQQAAEYAPNVRTLYADSEQVAQLLRRYPGANFRREQYVELSRLPAAAGVSADWVPEAWDFTGAQGTVEFRRGEERLERQIQTAEVVYDSALHTCDFEVEDLSYMRKPFRQFSTPAQLEGATLLLRTDNFAGTSREAICALMGPHADSNCVALFLASDLQRLRDLQAYCHTQDEWRDRVLAKMGPEDVVTLIDW